MMFLAQAQGFTLALVFCLIALLSFAAGARAVTKRQPRQTDLEAENDKLAQALCDVASSVEGIAMRGATGPVLRVYTLATHALGLPNRASAGGGHAPN